MHLITNQMEQTSKITSGKILTTTQLVVPTTLTKTGKLESVTCIDEGVQDSLTSVSVPDSDRQWFSAGASLPLQQRSNA